ncbi:unnamed protein product [Pieris macdunnoughi]|uniref:ODAD1 central coiled coil region domain-containing protein n=1 Tax=Pieris macdunnoughi TaxID=345717 RepID=A0A821RCU6_9NEOP|nr:unnamed protein product [Pieris macdunnoughi]
MEVTSEHSNDLEVIKKMEDEHLRLQRQVRMIQVDRQNRIMGVHPKFRRQDQLLRILKKDYNNLRTDLKIARSGAHKKNDKRMKNNLERALLLHTETQQECDEGIFLMKQVNELLLRKKKQLLRFKKIVNANNGQLEERRLLCENRLASTENRLEAATLRFNAVQSENKKIREEIEHMLKDRAIFNEAWTKMLNGLKRGKKFLTDLFESSTLAYDQRDEWCAKLRSVQEKGNLDQMVQVQEMRDLQKAFDHEMKLYNFLARKGVIRINRKQEEREEKMEEKEEEDLKKEFDEHVKFIDEITDYAKQEDINKIIDEFNRVEQENFSIYKLLTDFCAENEVLSRDLKNIQRDIEDRRDWNEMVEEKRQRKLDILRKKLAEQKLKTEENRNIYKEKEYLLKNTMESIREIFNMLECSLEPFVNLLGDKEPSLHRLDLTFRLIAEKIKEHIQITYYYERHMIKKGDKSSSRLKTYTVHPQPPSFCPGLPINLLVPADPCPACIEARWLSRVTESLETPFTTEMALTALQELAEDPAFERSDRIHQLTDCRVPQSRNILARRYLQYS